MKFHVTEEDIENGAKCSPDRCPIALAIRREMPEAVVFVLPGAIEIDGRVFRVTREIRNFIADFDACFSDMAPLTFELPV